MLHSLIKLSLGHIVILHMKLPRFSETPEMELASNVASTVSNVGGVITQNEVLVVEPLVQGLDLVHCVGRIDVIDACI